MKQKNYWTQKSRPNKRVKNQAVHDEVRELGGRLRRALVAKDFEKAFILERRYVKMTLAIKKRKLTVQIINHQKTDETEREIEELLRRQKQLEERK